MRLTESQSCTVVVEVGCYRGGTTKCLARATNRTVAAVDPYIGYGGAEAEFAKFQEKTAGLPNVVRERMTSGAASRSWRDGPVSLIFIDAVHDYANTAFDIEARSTRLVPGGVLALHDTDQLCFVGTRRAAFEALGRSTLLAHPENLTLLIVHGSWSGRPGLGGLGRLCPGCQTSVRDLAISLPIERVAFARKPSGTYLYR